MVYFVREKCDMVVLEVGLGGEFDATNVIDAPEIAAIIHIGLEHTEYLGDTLAKIAQTKSGIIKEGADVVLYENDPEVMEVVEKVCRDKNCPLHTRGGAGGFIRAGRGVRFPVHGRNHPERIFSSVQKAAAGDRNREKAGDDARGA